MNWTWRLRTRRVSFERPLLMGIVNVTPDSFSDGGRFLDPSRAIEHGLRLVEEGADLIDVGGESTRPGAPDVEADEELRRVIPVVEGLAARGIIVSVDTTKEPVARAAIDAGAEIVNDVGGLGDPDMRERVATTGAGAVVMHMQGTPRTMQDGPHYEDVVDDIVGILGHRMALAIEAGCDREALVVDPGIGFGKTLEHNLILCNRIESFGFLGRPILVGTSRKRFLGTVTGVEDPSGRDHSTAVSLALAAERGAAVLRTHNVALTREALAVTMAIVNERAVDYDRTVHIEPRTTTIAT
jgi:dihydropteroate synthase